MEVHQLDTYQFSDIYERAIYGHTKEEVYASPDPKCEGEFVSNEELIELDELSTDAALQTMDRH